MGEVPRAESRSAFLGLFCGVPILHCITTLREASKHSEPFESHQALVSCERDSIFQFLSTAEFIHTGASHWNPGSVRTDAHALGSAAKTVDRAYDNMRDNTRETVDKLRNGKPQTRRLPSAEPRRSSKVHREAGLRLPSRWSFACGADALSRALRRNGG